MRDVDEGSAVRLYRLDGEAGTATTLFYGRLDEALALAAAESEDVQAQLFVQTRTDVAPYLDLIDE